MAPHPPTIRFVDVVQRLLESLGDPVDRDELVALSGVGLCFPWRAGTPCDEVAVVPEIPSQVLGTLGYAGEFFTEESPPDRALFGERDDFPADRAFPRGFYLDQIRRSLDAGRPVVGFGLVDSGPSSCLIVGSDDDGVLVESPGQAGGVQHVADWYDRCAGVLVVGERTGQRPVGAAAYERVAAWAHAFRNTEDRAVGTWRIGLNWSAYPLMIEWLHDDDAWATDAQVEANQEWLWARGLDRLEAYRTSLLAALRHLEAEHTGLVNPPAFRLLEKLLAAVSEARRTGLPVHDRAAREQACAVVEDLGDLDAALQWTLFMPGFVRSQVQGFAVEQHEYRELPAARFVHVPLRPGEAVPDADTRRALLAPLDGLPDSGFDHDLLLLHHGGASVDEGPECPQLLGRFLAVDVEVPPGFEHLDFVPDDDGAAGPPYLSRFAYTTFVGPDAVVHAHDGFDVNALYDTSRNLVLADGVPMPYPAKYWTAEAFLDNTGRAPARHRWGCLFATCQVPRT